MNYSLSDFLLRDLWITKIKKSCIGSLCSEIRIDGKLLLYEFLEDITHNPLILRWYNSLHRDFTSPIVIVHVDLFNHKPLKVIASIHLSFDLPMRGQRVSTIHEIADSIPSSSKFKCRLSLERSPLSLVRIIG